MMFDKQVYEKYFEKKISKNELDEILDINILKKEGVMIESLKYAIDYQDSEYLYYLIYTLHLKECKFNFEELIEYLNILLLELWHNVHEDIVRLLEKYGNEKSVDILYEAIFLKLDYLEWDENYSFERRCVMAISKIHTSGSEKILRELESSSNEMISDVATKQLIKRYGVIDGN